MNDIGYSKNVTDINKTREVTVKCNGKRFRLFLEIAQGCYGNCLGCSLSMIDRKESIPSFTIEQIKKTFDYFIPIINNKDNLRTTVINFGVGDYFLLKNNYLEELAKETNSFFSQLTTIRNVISLTSTLLTIPEKMEEKLQILCKYLHPTQIIIDSVIDPSRLKTDYDKYSTNLNYIKTIFPFFDLAINIHSDLTKEDAQLLAKFVNEHHILNLDIQYAINNTNYYRVKIDQLKFEEFFFTLKEQINDKNALDLSISQPEIDDNLTIQEAIENHAHNMLKERVYVDNKGDIYPLEFAYGDLILDNRFSFPPIGNINDNYINNNNVNYHQQEHKVVHLSPSLKSNMTLNNTDNKLEFDQIKIDKMFKNGEMIIQRELYKIYLKNTVCHHCNYKLKCYSSGYSFYNKYSKDKTICDNIGKNLYETNQ